MKNEFTSNICIECSNKFGSCCDNHPFVPLTISDIKKIKSKGLKLKDFVKAEKYSKKDIIGPEKWWLDSFIYIGKKPYRLMIKKNKNGKCIFLKDKKGCTLKNCRPIFCKMYPFWIHPKNKKVIFDKSQINECYLAKKNNKLSKKIKMIQENQKKLKSYYLKIKKDCISNKKIHKKLILQLIK